MHALWPLLCLALAAPVDPGALAQLVQAGAFAEAKALAQEQLAAAEGDAARALALREWGTVLEQAGEPAKALEVHEQSLALHERLHGPMAVETVRARNEYLMALASTEGAATALEAARAQVAAVEQAHGNDSFVVAVALIPTAALAEDVDDIDAALTHHLRCVDILAVQPPERAVRLAAHLNAAGRLYLASDAYAEAEAAYRRALEAPSHDRDGRAVTLSNLATLLADIGRLDEASRLMDQAVRQRITHHGVDSLPVARTRAKRALVRFRAGELTLAREDTDHALALLEEHLGSDDRTVANARTVSGHIAQAMGDRALARQSYEQARAVLLQLEGRDLRDAGAPTTSLALMALADGDVEGALAWLDEVQDIEARSGASTLERVATTVNRGALVLELGKLDDAAEAFLGGLRILDEAGLTASEHRATLLDALAVVRRKQGDLDGAIAMSEQALPLRVQQLGPHHPAVADSHFNLGTFYYRARDLERAHEHYLASMEILERIGDASHKDLIEQLERLAQLEMSMGRPEVALERLERLFHGREVLFLQNMAYGTPRQKYLFVQSYSGGLNVLLSLCLQRLDTPACHALATDAVLGHKGRVLEVEHDAMQRVRGLEGAGERLAALEAALGRWDAVQRDPSAGPSARHAARAEVEAVQDQLSRFAADLAPTQQAVTDEAVRAQLPEDAVLVEFIAYDAPPDWARHYAALVLTPDGTGRVVELGEAATIDAMVATVRRDLHRLIPQRAEVARALHDALLEPVSPWLGEASHLILAPDGALALLPFDLLPDSEGTLLHERFLLSSLTAGRELLRLSTPPPPGGPPRVLVNPDFSDPELEPLPGTAQEGARVSRLLKRATLLTGAEATVAAVRTAPTPVVLHIATHGRFATSEDARAATAMVRSGLELAGEDAFLSAAELSTLDLRATELVVLSACETGVGEVLVGEGVAGLRRGLQLAGSRTQVLSLWRVDDNATRILMVDFYRHLLRGTGRAEALRRAKQTLREDARYASPRYWAAFVLSGDWGPLPRPLVGRRR